MTRQRPLFKNISERTCFCGTKFKVSEVQRVYGQVVADSGCCSAKCYTKKVINEEFKEEVQQ